MGLLLAVVCGLLIVLASVVVEHVALGVQALVVAAPGLRSGSAPALEHRLSSYGTWAQLPCGMGDLPR